MIKTSLLENKYYDNAVRKSIKSRWFPVFIVGLILIHILFRLAEPQILSFVSGVFPVEPYKSTAFYLDFVKLIFNEVLWIAGFLAVAWLYVVYDPFSSTVRSFEQTILGNTTAAAATIIIISFAASLLVAFGTLQSFPNSSDEYAYLYQAQTISQGKLWESAHELHDFFYFNHIANKDGIAVSRFPPGWPLILSSAYYLGINPILINPILGALLLFVFFSFVNRFYNPRVAIWSLIALALSSFFIFNSASFFSHTSCALFVVCFVYGCHLYFERPKPQYLVMAGFCLALVAITRYFTAFLIFIPFFFYFIRHCKLNCIKAFFWLGVGAAPCLAFLLWYNYSITGNALLPVTMWAYADESLGFVRGHTVFKGMEHVVRWIGMFIYWCSPAVLIIYLAAVIMKLRDASSRWSHLEGYLFLILMGGYFFYYQIGGNQYGPRFMFEALPFMIVLVVASVFQFNKKWIMGLFVAGLLFAIVKLPFIASRESRIIDQRKDLYSQVEQKDIRNAVVLVSSYTSTFRPMPIGDLTRNDVYYLNDVLYAIDLPARNQELLNYYPERAFYRYEREVNAEHGRLIRIR
ncbi:MAG TPA: glycosyltransferase family 39 protein [Chryseosolibacter sp.]